MRPTNLPPVSSAETVLVVEDDDAVRGLIERVLARAGYHVLAAADGDEALRVPRDRLEAVNLLLVDAVMPGPSGPELAGRMVRRSPDLKILYMTGYGSDVIERLGLAAADVRLLVKPFAPRQLLSAVRGALDG